MQLDAKAYKLSEAQEASQPENNIPPVPEACLTRMYFHPPTRSRKWRGGFRLGRQKGKGRKEGSFLLFIGDLGSAA